MASSPLEGQTAIVTGAASGIGAAIAIAFAAAGAKVGVNHRGNVDPAMEVLDRIRAANGEAMALWVLHNPSSRGSPAPATAAKPCTMAGETSVARAMCVRSS